MLWLDGRVVWVHKLYKLARRRATIVLSMSRRLALAPRAPAVLMGRGVGLRTAVSSAWGGAMYLILSYLSA